MPEIEKKEPQFRIGQVVVMGSVKKATPFRILEMFWRDGDWHYELNRANYASESMIRALFPEEYLPTPLPEASIPELPELAVTEDDRTNAAVFTSLGHQEEAMPHSEIEAMMAHLLCRERQLREAHALVAMRSKESHAHYLQAVESRETAHKAVLEVERLRGEIDLLTKERDDARSLIVTGDGSCDNCGKVPSIVMATSLCDECVDGIRRAEALESELASLREAGEKVRQVALGLLESYDVLLGAAYTFKNEVLEPVIKGAFLDVENHRAALISEPGGSL